MTKDTASRRKMLTLAAAGAAAPVALSLSPTAKAAQGAKYLILACDGGGMRGYLSSLILQQLNRQFGILGAGNKNINLYAGTSTGGLISLAPPARASTASSIFIRPTAQISFTLSPFRVTASCPGRRPSQEPLSTSKNCGRCCTTTSGILLSKPSWRVSFRAIPRSIRCPIRSW